MRLKSIRVRGLDPYIAESFLDVEALPGKLTALIGPNGAGKSTLLNFFPAATVAITKKFLKMPKPDGRTLSELSVAKDSFVEVKYEFGQDYTVRHDINGLNGKTDCSVTNGDGQALLKNKSGVTEFLGWAAEHSLPPEVFFGSVFSSQGTRGMLGMDPAERKTIILRVRGLERIEQRAEIARKNRSECDKLLAVASGKLQELIGDTVAFCEQNILRITDEKRAADEALRLGELTLKDLQDKNVATEKLRTEYNAAVLRRTELESREAKIRERIADLDERIKNNSDLLEKADEIRAAVTRSAQLAGLDERLADAERLGTSLEEEKAFLVQLDEKMSQFSAIALDADVIHKAVSESADHQASLKMKQEQASGQRVKAVETESELQAVRARINGNAQAGSEFQRRLDAAGLVVGIDGYLKARALAAVESVKTYEADIARKETKQGQYWTEIESFQVTVSTSKDKRLKNFQDPLELIAECKVDDPAAIAAIALSTNEDLESEAEEVPARLDEAKKQWSQLGTELSDLRDSLAIEQKAASHLPEIEAAEKTIAESQVALDASTTLYHSLVEESNAIIRRQDALTAEIEQTQSDVRWLNEQITGLEPLVGRAESLGQVEVVSIEVEKQKVRCGSEIERLTGEISKIEAVIGRAHKADDDLRAEKVSVDKKAKFAAPLAEAETKIAAYQEERGPLDVEHSRVLADMVALSGQLVEPPPLIPLSEHETAVAQARQAANQSDSALTLAQDALTRATAREARRADLQQEVATLGQDTADWKRLADDLGKGGVQALEVDAAAPELTTLANDLLRASGDTRFSLKISTTRMDSTGKREIEGFVIEITDSRKPGTKTGASGGEESYINKALAFALTMMACRHAGLNRPTIIDDEGDAALDVEFAPKYIHMLRRAAEVMNASKVIFTSHRPDSWNLADNVVRISNGQIEVA